MTEVDWLACDEPEPMLRHLRAAGFPQRDAGRRKLRLFGCACVRRKWRRATDPRSRALVVVAERYADGQAGTSQLVAAEMAALDAREEEKGLVVVGAGVQLPPWCLNRFAELFDRSHPQPAWEFALAATLMPRVVQATAEHGPEDEAQASLVRDIFGDPSRPIILTAEHRTADVATLARAAYDEREFPSGRLDPQRLAVLSDALEEAGATGEILDHLRSPGPHVRGCWAVDLVLGLT
jgi:hypothetical protein